MHEHIIRTQPGKIIDALLDKETDFGSALGSYLETRDVVTVLFLVAEILELGYRITKPQSPQDQELEEMHRQLTWIREDIQRVEDRVERLESEIRRLKSEIVGELRADLMRQAIGEMRGWCEAAVLHSKNKATLSSMATSIIQAGDAALAKTEGFLNLCHSEDGKLAGLVMALPYLSALAGPYTVAYRQVFENDKKDVAIAPSIFNHGTHRRLIQVAKAFLDKVEPYIAACKDALSRMPEHSKSETVGATVWLYEYSKEKGFVKTDKHFWYHVSDLVVELPEDSSYDKLFYAMASTADSGISWQYRLRSTLFDTKKKKYKFGAPSAPKKFSDPEHVERAWTHFQSLKPLAEQARTVEKVLASLEDFKKSILACENPSW